MVTNGPVPTTLELLEEKDMKVSGKVPEDKEGRRYLYKQLASYFTLVLSEYEKAMEGEKRDTMTSRSAYNAMVQTRENMKPVGPLSLFPFPFPLSPFPFPFLFSLSPLTYPLLLSSRKTKLTHPSSSANSSATI